MWQGRHVVLGVSGGIAAYKTVQLARDLTQKGASVDVVMTRGAEEFIGPVTFEAVTRRPVRSSIWERGGALDHITLGQAPDLIIVAPATAQLLSRCAGGVADDLLTALLLAATVPVLVAPAMNDEMYANPATQENVRLLEARGWEMIGPAVGALAEGPSERPGRMVEPVEIVVAAGRLLRGKGPLSGRKVVVTAGPTREALDPVRVITNRSSGKMGFRLAEAAYLRGAEVILISGPSSEPPPIGVTLVRVDSTADMANAVYRETPTTDVLIMAAAPADFRPTSSRDTKLPRADGGFTLAFESTEDILLGTLPMRHAGLTVVGFALETGSAAQKGAAKLQRKQLDLIVTNDALEPGAGFEIDTNIVTILDASGGQRQVSQRSKAEVAEAILDAVEAYRGDELRRWLELQRDLGGDELIVDTPTDLRAMITPPKRARLPERPRAERGGPRDLDLKGNRLPEGAVLSAAKEAMRPRDLDVSVNTVPTEADPRLLLPTLAAVAESVAVCTRCSLCRTRTNTVPGEGNPQARLLLVGEGPGETEDLTGRPFVGRAGELLDKMLLAIDVPRETVFIANVVKCRPPKNRTPLPDERASCMPYLRRQIELVKPAVILALGSTAAEALLGVKKSLGEIRLKVHHWDTTPLVITYHPAALLRNPNWKRPAWDDLRLARQLLDAST